LLLWSISILLLLHFNVHHQSYVLHYHLFFDHSRNILCRLLNDCNKWFSRLFVLVLSEIWYQLTYSTIILQSVYWKLLTCSHLQYNTLSILLKSMFKWFWKFFDRRCVCIRTWNLWRSYLDSCKWWTKFIVSGWWKHMFWRILQFKYISIYSEKRTQIGIQYYE
jgi:hypothetical protein